MAKTVNAAIVHITSGFQNTASMTMAASTRTRPAHGCERASSSLPINDAARRSTDSCRQELRRTLLPEATCQVSEGRLFQVAIWSTSTADFSVMQDRWPSCYYSIDFRIKAFLAIPHWMTLWRNKARCARSFTRIAVASFDSESSHIPCRTTD